MIYDSKLHDEAARLSALERLNILDTEREDQFDKITALVKRVIEIPFTAVTMLDKNRQWFKSSQNIEIREMPRELSFCNFTITEDKPVIVSDARSDARFFDHPAVISENILSYLGVPLVTPDGYAVGTLCAFSPEPHVFSDGQVELLSRFAEIVMDQLQMRQLAHRDQLTGALTRRGFLARVESEILESRQNGTSSALVMFDVDHFKLVNDGFGHAVGDTVLKSVVQSCEVAKKSHMAIGRVGGEEFALLLPRTTKVDAIDVAECLRAAIERDIIGNQQLKVTASFGIAPLDASINTACEWMAAADAPLYLAKNSGRNRCCCG